MFNKMARLIRRPELFVLFQKVGNLNKVMYKMDTENYLLNNLNVWTILPSSILSTVHIKLL